MAQFTLTPDAEAVLRRAVTAIRDNLELWNQDYWVARPQDRGDYFEESCGTTACLAGWIVVNEMKLTLNELAKRTRTSFGRADYIDIESVALKFMELPACSEVLCQHVAEDVPETCQSAFAYQIFHRYDLNGEKEGDFEYFVGHITKLTGIVFDLADTPA